MTLRSTLLSEDLWQEDCPGCLQTSVMLAHAFLGNKEFLGKRIQRFAALAGRDEYIWELTRVEEKRALFEELRKRGLPSLKGLISDWEKDVKRLFSLLDAVGDQTVPFAKRYADLFGLGVRCWAAAALAESSDPFTTWELIPLVEKRLSVSPETAREITLSCTVPDKQSWLDQERLSLLQLALHPSDAGLSRHAQRYSWMATTYLSAKSLTVDDFSLELSRLSKLSHAEISSRIERLLHHAEHVRKGRESAVAEHGIPVDLQETFAMVRQIAWLIDARKEMMLRLFSGLFSLLSEFESAYGLAVGDASWLLPDEVLSLAAGKAFDTSAVAERKKGFAYALFDDDEVFVTGAPASALIDAYLARDDGKTLRGLVASTGGISSLEGKVNVIMNVDKDRFDEGSVLVTSMTRPEFVPLMRRASAIITDEGGITCHAAVVSRELGIPCIIATRFATRRFSTGDAVRMDLSTGEVRKL